MSEPLEMPPMVITPDFAPHPASKKPGSKKTNTPETRKQEVTEKKLSMKEMQEKLAREMGGDPRCPMFGDCYIAPEQAPKNAKLPPKKPEKKIDRFGNGVLVMPEMKITPQKEKNSLF